MHKFNHSFERHIPILLSHVRLKLHDWLAVFVGVEISIINIVECLVLTNEVCKL